MTSLVEGCAHQCLLPPGQIALFDSLTPFHEELTEDVTVDELSLSTAPETVDDHQVASGSSLPATPAERPCTFCPSSLPLPPQTCPSRATLVLDLDGTLIASEELNAASSTYLWNTPAGARAPDYEAMGRRVWLRPGVKGFLIAVRPHFEVVLFTAATQNWAAAAIEQLDPGAEIFDVMLHRDHTTSDLMWDYVKDLSRLGRDLARVVIVDDNPLMFMYQPDNALHVAAYEASAAGGPDNVLPRVADVLINQVAPANDVREVLGPMAVAKSCITSTVSAATSVAQAAAEQHTQGPSNTVPSGIGDEIESGAGSAQYPMGNTADYGVSCSAATSGHVEDMHGDGNVDAVLFSGGSGLGDSGNTQSLHHDGEEPLNGLQHHLEGSPCCSGLSNSCESSGSLAEDAKNEASWDGEEEGAETFDEHGAAAQLGAGAVESCHPNRAWNEAQCNRGVSEALGEEEMGVNEGTALGCVEQEESDAAPSEELSVHSSEDFEALMDDAMAEYDSDVYESPYTSGSGYDYASQEEASSPAPKCSALVPNQAAGSGSDGSHCGFGVAISCSVRSEGGKLTGSIVSEPQLAAEQSFADRDSTSAVLPGAYKHVYSAEAEPRCSSGMPLAAAEEDSNAGSGSQSLNPSHCTEAAVSSLQIASCQTPDDAHLNQTPLPTGMVFLTDLNPAFGSGYALLGAAKATAGAPEMAVLPGQDVERGADSIRVAELLGCKRFRSEIDVGSDGPDLPRDTARRLRSAVRLSSRFRVVDGGGVHYADVVTGTNTVTGCAVLPAAETIVAAVSSG